MTDLSKISDSDLEALSKKDYKSLSDEGLQFLSENPNLYKTKIESENKVEAQPEPSWLEKTGSNIRDIYGGTARGMASLPLNWMPETSAKVNEGLQSLGVNPQSTAFHVGKIAGETVPMMGIAKAGSLVAEKLGASPELVKNIVTQGQIAGESGGIAQGFKNAGKSIAVGAPLGITTEALLHGKDAGLKEYALAGALGGLGPTAMNVIGSGLKTGVDLFTGKSGIEKAKQIAERIAGDKLQETIAYLRELSPKDVRTTAEALHGVADPKFASLEEIAKVTNGQPFLNKDIAKRQEWVNANKAVLPNLEPAVAHETNVNLARESELNALQGTKEQDLANKIRQFEQGTAKETPQFGLGETIVARRKENLKQAKAPFNDVYDENGNLVSEGLYTQLSNKYPQKFSLKPVYASAGNILSDLKTQLNPTVAKDVISKAESIFGPTASTLKTEIKELPRGQVRRTVGQPSKEKQGTLGQMHDLLSAIGDAERKLKNDPNQATTFYNLGELKNSVNDAINKGLPEDALKEYKNLSAQYKSQVAEPFYKGITGDISRVKGNQAPAIAPEDIATKYLSESNAQSFNKAFGKDPQAIQALTTGIEQKMMNSSNPEKFLEDNRFALNALDVPSLQVRLNDLADKIRLHGIEGKALEAERSAIPKTVLTESEQAASPANQARLLKEGIETALPNINEGSLTKLNPETFLNFMRNNRGNIENQLTDIGQQGHLNQIRSDMIRNQEMQTMAKANMGPTKDIINDTLWREKLPGLLNKAISIGNKGTSIVESKVAGAAGKELSKAMESPANLYALFQHLPADERNSILKALKGSGPTVIRSALSAINQQ